MADKKQNNIDKWKRMLDSPEDLPGEGMLNKSAAWEILYGRLHADPAPRTAWYWVAATVLTIIVVSWLGTERKKNDITKATDAVGYNIKNLRPSQPSISNRQPAAEKTAFIKHPITSGTDAVHRKPHYRNVVSFYPSPVVASSIPAVENQHAITVAAPVTGDSAKLSLVFTSKKKLRVLHINELGTVSSPDSEQPALAVQEKNNIRIRFKNNTSGNLSSLEKPEDTGIRIPLTN